MSAHLSTPWFRRAAVALAALVVLGATACSDDSGEQPSGDALQQITRATFAEGSARLSGEVLFADGARGPVEGVTRAEPPQGDVTFPVLAAGAPTAVHAVWTDGAIYVERGVTTDAAEVSNTLRLPDDRPWIRAIYQPLTVPLIHAYDPFRLLEYLDLRDLEARPEGTDTVGGTEQLDRYVVNLAGQALPPLGAQTAELLVDGEMRLRAVRLVGADRLEYTLSELGVDIAPVAPPEDQIDTGERQSVALAGPYEPAAEGTWESTTWRLLRAPAVDGSTCWLLETSAPLDPVAATQADGATCVDPYDPTLAPDDQVEVVVDSGSGAAFDAVVAVVPPGTTSASLQSADGSTRALVVDPGGFVVSVGPKSPLPVVLEVTTADGTVVTCGPGSVSSLEDLGDLPADEAIRLERLPWLCLTL